MDTRYAQIERKLDKKIKTRVVLDEDDHAVASELLYQLECAKGMVKSKLDMGVEVVDIVDTLYWRQQEVRKNQPVSLTPLQYVASAMKDEDAGTELMMCAARWNVRFEE